MSQTREIETTHIWFDGERRFDVVNPDRSLPTRLRLDETFETWVRRSDLSDDDPERLGRVMLSTGRVIKSRLNKDVPPAGNVAGGGNR